MKVDVLAGASRNEGGLHGAVLGLSRALVATGVEARLVSHTDAFTNEDLPHWAPVPVELHSAFGPLLSSPGLRRIVKTSESDLLHVHGIWVDRQWVALQEHRRTGKPVVISPHGMLDPWAVRNAAWKKKMVGALFANESLRRARCIHALCESEAEAIRAYGLKTPVAIIPNGIALPEMKHAPERTDKKRLLFLGRIHPKKGLTELISGWAKAQSLHPKAFSNWELLIAGWDDGGHEVGLKAQAATLDGGNSVQFIGPQFGDKKDTLLRGVDAFILPSFSEGLPMSVLEAWSYGLPVVMTDFCNIPEGFAAGAALRIEPTVESIAQGLAQLESMSDADLATMGTHGRALVERSFTWDKIAQDMKTVYEWGLGGEKPSCIQEV